MKRPSCQLTLSSRIRLSLRQSLQSLNRVQMEEGLSPRLSIYHLRNRTNHRRAENDRLRFGEPDSRRLVRHNGQMPLVAEVAVDHCQDSLPYEPLEHVKDSGWCRGHVGCDLARRIVVFTGDHAAP